MENEPRQAHKSLPESGTSSEQDTDDDDEDLWNVYSNFTPEQKIPSLSATFSKTNTVSFPIKEEEDGRTRSKSHHPGSSFPRASDVGVSRDQKIELRRPSGAVFVGCVKDGQASGRGVQSWPNGAVYEGAWVDDAMEGEGVLRTSDGAYYNGRWVGSRQEGHGVYVSADGSRYEGQWSAGKMHGKGRYVWPDRSTFEGEFVNGERSGHGVLQYADGSKYEGEWCDSKQHGTGLLISHSGHSRSGRWEHGQRKEWFASDLGDPQSFVPSGSSSFGRFDIEEGEALQPSHVSVSGRCTQCSSGKCAQFFAQCGLM